MIQLQLEYIDFSQCPHCEARVHSMRRELQHTNGEWNEHISFRCGAAYHYSPNFRRVALKEWCPKDPDMVIINDYMNRIYVAGCTALSKSFNKVAIPKAANKEMRRALKECLHDMVYPEIINDLINSLQKNIKRNDHFRIRR